ncbi:hypothetical protein P3S67_000887 [Capsicum chacoense]
MTSKGNINGRRKKSKKGPDNILAGQYPPPPAPPVTTTFQLANTNIPSPPRSAISLPNSFFMPPPSDQLQTSSSQNSLHSSSSYVPSTSSTPSLSGLRIGGLNTPTSPSIDSAIESNAKATASQNLQFKEVLEYDKFGRLRIVPYCDGVMTHFGESNDGLFLDV